MKRLCRPAYIVPLAALLLLAVAAGCQSRQDSYARAPQPLPAGPAVASAPAPATPNVYYLPAQPLGQSAAPDIAYQAAPASSWQAVSGKTVILDAGHGGNDEGTCHFGLREKDINLDLANRTAALLRARGCTVIMTRSSDAFIPLPERSAIANRYPNAALVSIHVNSAPGNPGVNGVETFVLSKEFSNKERGRMAASRFKANGDSSVQGKQALANLAVTSKNRGPALAESLQRSLTGRLGEPDRGVKQRDLAVLRETYFGPAALVEVGFLTNPRTADRMRTDAWRSRTSEALCEGICSFLQQPL